MTLKKAAVIGGGVSGISAAYLLQQKYEVSIFEKGPCLGGHTNTYIVKDGPDSGTAVDTGFIVLNDKTYPNLHRFLARLGVSVRFADMSFGFACEESGLQYSGRGPLGLFAQPLNFFNPAYLRFLKEIRRFCTNAIKDLDSGSVSLDLSLDQYLDNYRYSLDLKLNYVVPMGAAIWSAPVNSMLNFPAITFLNFFRNHGLLSLKDRPRWQTVVGGSYQYVNAFCRKFAGKIFLNTGVEAVTRTESGAKVILSDNTAREFDLLVIAVHADQAYRMVKDKSTTEEKLLGAWSYQKNSTVLHTDESVMNISHFAKASWNYRREAGRDLTAPLSVTYDMNRLQGLRTKRKYYVTLNGNKIRESTVLTRIEYEHPVFDSKAIRTQEELQEQNGHLQTWYCGSYFKYGFHEDAITSSVKLAAALGITEW